MSRAKSDVKLEQDYITQLRGTVHELKRVRDLQEEENDRLRAQVARLKDRLKYYMKQNQRLRGKL